MEPGFLLQLLGISLGASALGGMLGMASGIFIVPLLVLFGGVDIHAAIGAGLVSVIACSCGSAADFLEGGLTNIRLAVVLEIATTLGALAGVLLAGVVSVTALYLLFAAVLLASVWQMLVRRDSEGRQLVETARGWADGLRLDGVYPDQALGRQVRYQVRRLPLGMSLMFGAGVISALLGIGSGVLKVPAMDAALQLPIKVSSATSNFMIGVTAAASAGAYFVRGDILPSIAGPVALGSVVGSILGARILMRTPNERLRLLFAAVLLILAVQMLLMGLGVDRMRSAA